MSILAAVIVGWIALDLAIWLIFMHRYLTFREFVRTAADAIAIAAFASMLLIFAAQLAGA